MWERLVLVVLSLMLAHIVVIVVHVSYCHYSARRAQGFDIASRALERSRKELVAGLNVEIGSLKSIALTAPYLGLAGTCVGILSIFHGFAMARSAALAMISSEIGAAPLATAAGLLVAITGVVSYNYLRARLDLFEDEIFGNVFHRRLPFLQVAPRFRRMKRFSELPAFALIATPVLAISLAGLMTFSSFHPPRGLPVRLEKIGAHETEHFSVEPIIVEILAASGNGPPVVYLNSKKTPSDELRGRLRNELRVRSQSLAYVQVEDKVSWADVVNVIDVAEGLNANVVLLTISPNIHVASKSIR